MEYIFRRQLLTWSKNHNILFVEDFTLEQLQGFRASWKEGALSSKKKQERIAGFFNFCLENGWIQRNPAKRLSRIRVTQAPTDYFPADEFEKITQATYVYDQRTVNKPEHLHNQTRLRTLTLLMRWSGLSIRDAVTLERTRLSDDDKLFLYRSKTGVPVYVPLPHNVAEALRNVPAGPAPNPRYFFWSGVGSPKSAVGDWQRAYRKLFDIADIRHADKTRKRCFPHMFRDTFAVSMLLAGVPLDQVSILLGHSSVKTTEKHYAPFVKARQDQIVASVQRAWKVMAQAAKAGSR